MGADEDVLRLRPDATSWVTEGDTTIALDLDHARYLGVNRAGTVLWNALAEGTTRTGLVERLTSTFDVDAGRAGADVDAFLATCRERGLLA